MMRKYKNNLHRTQRNRGSVDGYLKLFEVIRKPDELSNALPLMEGKVEPNKTALEWL